jgi:Zn-dependent protease
MLAITLRDITLLLDFTAPAWLAWLSVRLPHGVFMQTLAACLLHECAHLLAMRLVHQKPQSLRVSAAGLCLRMRGAAVCPTKALCAVLLAGPCMNFLAAAAFYAVGREGAAGANLSLGLLNLLPFSGTDGGALLAELLSQRLMHSRPERIAPTVRAVSSCTALLLAAVFLSAQVRSLSLWGMLLYLTVTNG